MTTVRLVAAKYNYDNPGAMRAQSVPSADSPLHASRGLNTAVPCKFISRRRPKWEPICGHGRPLACVFTWV